MAHAAVLPINSVVRIVAVLATDLSDANTWIAVQAGSGFVIDAQKKQIVTNAHVVLQEKTGRVFSAYLICTIQSSTDSASCDYISKLIFADIGNDLALLQITGNPPGKPQKVFNQPAINIPLDTLPEIGDQITVIGFPLLGGETITLTRGIASGVLNGDDGEVIFLKTDSSLISGTSGGIAVDGNGIFIGVPSLVFTDSYTEEQQIGILLAGPYVKRWIDDIKDFTFSVTPTVSYPSPTMVTGLKAQRLSSSSVKLQWDGAASNSGIKNYEIQYDIEPLWYSTNPKNISTNGADTVFNVTGLDPKKTYYFAVRGIDNDGNIGKYWSDEVVVNMTLSDTNLIFSDVGLKHKNAYAIAYLKENEIIAGYPDGTFRPNNTIKRGELMKIVVLGQGIFPEPSQYNDCFPDVKNEWFAPYVCYAKEKGWVAGYQDGSFQPGQDVNFVESLKIIEEAYEMPFKKVSAKNTLPSSMQDQWYTKYLGLAVEFNIFHKTSDTFDPAEKVSRAKTSEHLYRTILLEPHKGEFSSQVWKDADGTLVDPSKLFGLKDEVSWVYRRTNKDNTIQRMSSHLVKGGCEVTEGICYKISQYIDNELDEEGKYQAIKDAIMIPEWTDYYPKISFYDEEKIALSSHNILRYFRPRELLEKSATGLSLRIFDFVQFMDFLGSETVSTLLGSKQALKVKEIILSRGEIQTDAYTIPITLRIEIVSYYVKDLGIVKRTSSVAEETPYGSITIADYTDELIDYAEGRILR